MAEEGGRACEKCFGSRVEVKRRWAATSARSLEIRRSLLIIKQPPHLLCIANLTAIYAWLIIHTNIITALNN